MGVTIHYCLGARDGNAVERALDLAELMARKWGMKAERKAPKWLIIWPHPEAETLEFYFHFKKAKEEALLGKLKRLTQGELEWLMKELNNPLANKWVCSGSCKTQFAGVDVHMQVAEILRLVASFMSYVEIDDEADYYETRNLVQAAQAMNICDEIIGTIADRLQKAVRAEVTRH
jgi:hypothetical protein